DVLLRDADVNAVVGVLHFTDDLRAGRSEAPVQRALLSAQLLPDRVLLSGGQLRALVLRIAALNRDWITAELDDDVRRPIAQGRGYEFRLRTVRLEQRRVDFREPRGARGPFLPGRVARGRDDNDCDDGARRH